jgi:hypothetical protein
MLLAVKQLRNMADSGVRRDRALNRITSLVRDRATLTRTDLARVESEQAYATVAQLKDIALMSATSVASQIDLFMRQLLTALSEGERMRVQAPFDKLRRATLQGVSESFRRALIGQAQPALISPPIDTEVVPEAAPADPPRTQAPPTPTARPRAAQAVPIPGVS